MTQSTRAGVIMHMRDKSHGHVVRERSVSIVIRKEVPWWPRPRV